MKTCENCGEKHDDEYGSGRFCSSKCSRGFSTKSKRKEINAKVSKTLTKPLISKLCDFCGKCFEVHSRKKNQKTCSISCAAKLKWKDETYRSFMSDISSKTALKSHENPEIKFGWSKRTKFEMSYPEKIANATLKEGEINFEYEYPFHPYFIDFALVEHKIAIEIDGQQHKLPERIICDNKKDAKLLKNGWKVYRIKWPEENIVDEVQKILASIPSP